MEYNIKNDQEILIHGKGNSFSKLKKEKLKTIIKSLKITIFGEQEHSVQSTDRTKAVQAWRWGNICLPKPRKWPSEHLYLKINVGSMLGRIPSNNIWKQSHHAQWCFILQKVHLCLQPCSLDNTLNRISSAWESFNIRQKLDLLVFGATHILNLLPTVWVKLTQVRGWV